MPPGQVVALHRTTVRHGGLEPLAAAMLVADLGIEGDAHGRPGSSRQVLVVEAEVLDDLRLPSGAVREQITARGLGAIELGMMLRLGHAEVEVTQARVPCGVMDKVRPGLRRQLEGRGGWCGRVVAGGEVRVGDAAAVTGTTGDPAWLLDVRTAFGEWEASAPKRTTGWSAKETLAHLVGWLEHVGSDGNGVEDVDAFNAATLARLADVSMSQLWARHDLALTAFVDAARAGDDLADWGRALARHYREHV